MDFFTAVEKGDLQQRSLRDIDIGWLVPIRVRVTMVDARKPYDHAGASGSLPCSWALRSAARRQLITRKLSLVWSGGGLSQRCSSLYGDSLYTRYVVCCFCCVLLLLQDPSRIEWAYCSVPRYEDRLYIYNVSERH